MFGRENPVTQTSSYEGYGFYSTETNPLTFAVHLNSVPGQLMNEAGLGPDGLPVNSMVRATRELVVEVDPDQYSDARTVLMAWERKSHYSLGSNDCVTFVQEVGSALGLNLPVRSVSHWTLHPEGYIAALMGSVDAPVDIHVPGYDYVGSVVGGLPHGQGRATFREGNTEIVYEGNFKAGRRTGHGRVHDNPETYSYDGDFVNGIPQGEGTFVAVRTGVVYTGHFSNGHPDGHGHEVGRKDDFDFDGNFSSGTAQGEGTFKSSTFELTGHFDHNRPNGAVTVHFSNGDTFSGSTTNGAFAHGTYRTAGGSSYTGDFQAGIPNGAGNWKFSDGSSFTGTFVNGKADGDGTMSYPDGTTITSKWHGGEPEATGVVKLPSGEHTEGHHFGDGWHWDRSGQHDGGSGQDHGHEISNGEKQSKSGNDEVAHVDLGDHKLP